MKVIDKIMVSQMTSPRSGNPVANQFVIDTTEGVYFQSYRSIIALRKGGQLYLDKNKWDYSRTTGKYRNRFTGLDTAETKKRIKDGSILLVDLN